jgi:hypothetical protein
MMPTTTLRQKASMTPAARRNVSMFSVEMPTGMTLLG